MGVILINLMACFNVNGGIVRRNVWVFEFSKFFRVLRYLHIQHYFLQLRKICLLNKKCSWNSFEKVLALAFSL